VARFNYGVLSGFSCFLVGFLSFTALLDQSLQYPKDIFLAVLGVAQIFVAFASAFMLLSIERRPDVFRPDGKLVERQYQRSILSRMTFSWSSDLVDLVTFIPSLVFVGDNWC
jgi:hypothetical protein